MEISKQSQITELKKSLNKNFTSYQFKECIPVDGKKWALYGTFEGTLSPQTQKILKIKYWAAVIFSLGIASFFNSVQEMKKGYKSGKRSITVYVKDETLKNDIIKLSARFLNGSFAFDPIAFKENLLKCASSEEQDDILLLFFFFDNRQRIYNAYQEEGYEKASKLVTQLQVDKRITPLPLFTKKHKEDPTTDLMSLKDMAMIERTLTAVQQFHEACKETNQQERSELIHKIHEGACLMDKLSRCNEWMEERSGSNVLENVVLYDPQGDWIIQLDKFFYAYSIDARQAPHTKEKALVWLMENIPSSGFGGKIPTKEEIASFINKGWHFLFFEDESGSF